MADPIERATQERLREVQWEAWESEALGELPLRFDEDRYDAENGDGDGDE